MLDLKNILNNPKEVSSSLLSRGYKLDLKFIQDKAQERKKDRTPEGLKQRKK